MRKAFVVKKVLVFLIKSIYTKNVHFSKTDFLFHFYYGFLLTNRC